MKLTYIFHSGFAVETQSCVLVFDYWMDPADCMPVILSKGKPVYVLVSHFHDDDYSAIGQKNDIMSASSIDGFFVILTIFVLIIKLFRSWKLFDDFIPYLSSG